MNKLTAEDNGCDDDDSKSNYHKNHKDVTREIQLMFEKSKE